MVHPPLVFPLRMVATRISVVLAGAMLAVAGVGCGQLTPLENEQSCPCAPGYTCWDGACLTGDVAAALVPDSIALGSEAVPGAPDASALTTPQKVSGRAAGILQQGTQVAFSYATSIWPTPYGWQVDGWLLSASAGDSFTFQLWADDDSGAHPLSLLIYGPLERLGTATCSGASVGNGPLVGTEIRWMATAEGTFFAAPFHDVVETPSGLAFEGLNDNDYASAYIVMNPAE